MEHQERLKKEEVKTSLNKKVKTVDRVDKGEREMTFHSFFHVLPFFYLFLTFFLSFFYLFVPLPPRARKMLGNQKTAVFLCEKVEKGWEKKGKTN